MKLAAAILVSVLAVVFISGLASAAAQMPSGRDVVAASAFPSVEPVGRGSSFQIAVVLKIRDGFHINARQPSAEYLIPTDLRSEVPVGFKGGDTTYPKGELRKFSFSKAPLNVYEDKVVIRMMLTALPDAPLGMQHIPFKLRYQACSMEACLPPVTVPVDASVNLAANSAGSRANHPELFPPQH